jgi:hypothetical protein
MADTRIHAFAVTPQRHDDQPDEPIGGPVPFSNELRAVLAETDAAAKFSRRTEIAFDVDRTSRTNTMRDLIMTFAFGTGRASITAARSIAVALSRAMDRRSTSSPGGSRTIVCGGHSPSCDSAPPHVACRDR